MTGGVQHRACKDLEKSSFQTVPSYNLPVSELIQKCSEATVFVPNRELPLGYFCSVTPP